MLTGIGGEKWKQAAQEVGKALGVKVNAYSIGWKQDWEDVYGDWARRREIEDGGCVVMRPDRTICYRSMQMVEDCEKVVETVVRSVLGRS